MKAKSLIPLVVVFAILAGLVVLKQMTKEQPTIVDQVKLEPLVPDGVAKKDVAVLEFYAGAKPDDKVVLTRSADDPDVWRITSHFNAPANQEKIEGFVDKVLALKGEARATVKDDAGLTPYELGDDTAFHVTAYKQNGKEPLFQVLVGKAPAYNQVFMRAEGAKDVYTLDTNLRREAGVYSDDLATAPKPDSWINKEVVNIAKDTISKITVQTPDKRFVIAKETKEVPVEASENKDAPADKAAEEKTGSESDISENKEEKSEEAEKPKTKTETTWILAEGGAGSTAKQAGIENVAGAFAPLTASDVMDPTKLADWGLETPKFTCTLAVKDHDGDVVIEGGRPDPNGDGYVRVASADASVIFKLSKYTFEKVFPKGRDLVDLPSLSVDKKNVTQVDLTQPDGNVSLTKTGDAWTIAKPVADLTPQTTTIDSLVAALAAWQPADYADSADGKGLDTPERSVTFSTNAGETHTITLGNESEGIAGRYARLDGTGPVLVMSKSDLDRVFTAPSALYQHALFDISEDDIARINVSRAEDGFTLAREGTGWTVTVDGAASPAKEDAANNLASAIASFQISEINFAQPELTTPVDTTVQAVMKDGTEHVLRFGPEQDGMYAVAVNGKSETFEAKSLDVKEVAPASASLKEPEKAPETPASAPEAQGPPAPAPAGGESMTPVAPAPAETKPAAPAPVEQSGPAATPAAPQAGATTPEPSTVTGEEKTAEPTDAGKEAPATGDARAAHPAQ